jgi:protoporphyrinogen oxidase
VRELGLQEQVVTMPSKTGMFFNGALWRLSTPLDVLRFEPLSFFGRLRLGWLVFQVRKVKDWRAIEHLSIREWLEPLCGSEVFRVVWEPLIRAKFGIYADEVNAVWFWKKLVLRGGTRNTKGGEELVYFRGGFGHLAHEIADDIVRHGGHIRYGVRATGVRAAGRRITVLDTSSGSISADHFLFTPALPLIASVFDGVAPSDWLQRLRRVRYLGNMCLVLELDRSLSDTYWINVNDPGFPFVGVIEHTNFDTPTNYAGKHIVFLSRYLPVEDPVWHFSEEQYLEFALEHLQRMFPAMRREWITDWRVWRAEYAQPVTERGYSGYVPSCETPFVNAHVATMAQIYPEDRGTNYAIREGRAAAERIVEQSVADNVAVTESVP